MLAVNKVGEMQDICTCAVASLLDNSTPAWSCERDLFHERVADVLLQREMPVDSLWEVRSVVLSEGASCALMGALLLLLLFALERRRNKPTQESSFDLTDSGYRHGSAEAAGSEAAEFPLCGKTRLVRSASSLAARFEPLVFTEALGSGFFKSVYRGIWQGEEIAVSCLKAGGVHSEARLHASIPQHSCVATLLQHVVVTDGSEYGLMELLPMGSLDTILRNGGLTLSVQTRVEICRQICRGMTHLAANGILHRDLALRNVFVGSLDPVFVKIGDFGMATQLSCYNAETLDYGEMASVPLPVRWLAPEVIQSLTWSEKSDIWAFGVTMWELLSNGNEPYAATCLTDADVVHTILRGCTLPQPPGCPDAVYALMKHCWRFDPADRPTFKALTLTLSRLCIPPEHSQQALPEKKPHRFELALSHGYCELSSI